MVGYHACSAFINDDVAVCVDSYDYQTCTHDDDDAEILTVESDNYVKSNKGQMIKQ